MKRSLDHGKVDPNQKGILFSVPKEEDEQNYTEHVGFEAVQNDEGVMDQTYKVDVLGSDVDPASQLKDEATQKRL